MSSFIGTLGRYLHGDIDFGISVAGSTSTGASDIFTSESKETGAGELGAV
jgi:hypothetical protein